MVAFGSAKFNSLPNLPAKGHKRALAVLPSFLRQLTLLSLIFPIPSFNPYHHSFTPSPAPVPPFSNSIFPSYKYKHILIPLRAT